MNSWENLCFNPTLIRLRLNDNRFKSGRLYGFQSHIDSIKATLCCSSFMAAIMFQSHIDSIKAAKEKGKEWDVVCFNPTLIRLRRSIVSDVDEQSPCFNPTLIRLRLITFKTSDFVLPVSIPH